MPEKRVYTIIEKGEGKKGFWCDIGAGWVNRDGSLNLRLDALPVNGNLHVRDFEPRDRGDSRGNGGNGARGPNPRLLPPQPRLEASPKEEDIPF